MASRSPKRKRDHALPLDTRGPIPRLAYDGDGEESSDGSPRAKTARTFERLEINSLPPHRVCGVGGGSKQSANITGHGPPSPDIGQEEAATFPNTKADSAGRLQIASVSSQPSHNASPEQATKSSRSRTPPLSAEVSENFWHDAEITGHNPDDPDDDGYGINGIGFRPTAAMAWSRSQRRKQQLNNYKYREAQEARQKRSERRKRSIDNNDIPSIESSPRKSIRVHFEDG